MNTHSREASSDSFIFFSVLYGAQLLQERICPLRTNSYNLALLHSERPNLYGVLAVLSAKGLKIAPFWKSYVYGSKQKHHKNYLSLQKNDRKNEGVPIHLKEKSKRDICTMLSKVG